MHIQVEKQQFFPLISQIQGILEKRTVIPILANVLIKASKKEIKVYASDSELSFSASFLGEVKKEGRIVVSGKRLFEIIKEFPEGKIDIKEEAQYRIKIKKGDSVFQIHGLKGEDYPEFPPIKSKKFQKLNALKFLEGIDKVIYSTSLDESRYHLTGVFYEVLKDKKYRLVSTDGHRMSFIDISNQDSFPFDNVIIPKKGLQEIKRMLLSDPDHPELEISVEKPRFVVKFKNQTLTIRLIEGRYPDYKQLVPKTKNQEIVLKKEEFLSSLRRVSVLASARFKGIVFSFTNNKELSMEFSNPDIGEAKEKVPCKFKGGDIKVRFNSRYILDILNNIHEENIRIFLNNQNSPGVLQGEKNKDYTCIVMPMKF